MAREIRLRVWDKSSKMFIHEWYLGVYGELYQRDYGVYSMYKFTSAEGHSMLGALRKIGKFGDRNRSTASGLNAGGLLAIERMHGNRKKSLIFMEFTGIKDKNGKGIYEGDIVSIRSSYWEEDVINDIREVTDIRKDYSWLTSEVLTFEIIGNIYQNQEILSK